MKASNVISILQNLIKQYGDLEVISYEVLQSDFYHSYSIPVVGINYKSKDEDFCRGKDCFVLVSDKYKFNQ